MSRDRYSKQRNGISGEVLDDKIARAAKALRRTKRVRAAAKAVRMSYDGIRNWIRWGRNGNPRYAPIVEAMDEVNAWTKAHRKKPETPGWIGLR